MICRATVLGFFMFVLLTAVGLGQVLTDDTWAGTSGNTNHDGDVLRADAFANGGCFGAPATTFLKFDLSGFDHEADANTVLTLFVPNATGNDAGDVLALYRVADDSWTQETLTGDNRPALAAVIETLDATTVSTGTSLAFSSQALKDYVEEESFFTGGGDVTAGDNTISFAINYSQCAGFGFQIVNFDSLESCFTCPPTPATLPVELSAFNIE